MPLAPWITEDDLPADRPALPGGPEEWAGLADLATGVLFALSGSRWAGEVQRVVEIVAVGGPRWHHLDHGGDFWWDGSWGAHVLGGEVYNHDCCSSPLTVRLPHAPVRTVERVEIGGTVRDAASYRLRDGRWLEELTGSGWPTCDPGVVVTYNAGTDPPGAGREAAATLLLHLAYGRVGDPRCRLPGNTTAISRQGITQSFTPAAEIIAAGRTGLTEVDLWLASVNPTNRRHRPSSWSPDTHPRSYPRATEEIP